MPTTGTPIKPAKQYTRVVKDYYDPRRLIDGFIPEGQGATPAEIYHEWVAPATRRLSQPNQSDIAKRVTDLEQWRQAVKEWIQAGNLPENIGGILDWYHYPERRPSRKFAKSTTSPSTNGNAPHPTDLSYKEWLLRTYGSTFAAAIKSESELQHEYKQWRHDQGLPPGI